MNHLAAVTESLEVRNAVIPADVQAEEQSVSQLNPYGEDHGMEAAVPVLQKALEAQSSSWTPSAPPRVSNEQALRSDIPQAQDDDQEGQRPDTNPEAKITNKFVALAEVHHRARHMAQLDLDQCTQEHSDGWIKVDNQANRTPPDDDDQPILKQIEATNMGRKCNFAMRKTNEEGTFAVTSEETKVGGSKTIQGSVKGAWILDTLDRAKQIISQAELAEQELIVCSKKATNATREDLTNARMVGPMLVTDGRAHFS